MDIKYITYQNGDNFVVEATEGIELVTEGKTEAEALQKFQAALEAQFDEVEHED